MSTVLWRSGSGSVGNRVLLQLLAASRVVRTIARSSTRVVGARAILDAGGLQPRGSFIAADPDHDAGRLDGVAGSEFVDDRLRLFE